MNKRQLDLLQIFFNETGGASPRLSLPVQHNPLRTIKNLSPHYTNEGFKTPQTVYLASGYKLSPEYVKGAHYVYSDRIWQNVDHERVIAARDSAKAVVKNMECAAHLELWLRAVLDDPVEKLVHIMAGFVNSTGYAYQVYGFIPGKKEPQS